MKSSNLETPIQFITNKFLNRNLKITYTDLREISQGGPEVGYILINDIKFTDYLYGGPFLYFNKKIYIPQFRSKLFGNGFKIAEINISSREIKTYGKTKDLIFLDKVEKDKVFYFKDMERKLYCYFDLIINKEVIL
ncbi:hypothetical protein [Mesonia sp. K7]|uniref:hypothetical protein n=1 Tax=Mesonia sp. K7 TaxID=2218606 RepID=UPI000DAAB4C3|nr:hypothetical protein [Mesonia sp. K7]PZD77465.1 hypothetical protein DNG35_09120 [Mesonia sp. K7]